MSGTEWGDQGHMTEWKKAKEPGGKGSCWREGKGYKGWRSGGGAGGGEEEWVVKEGRSGRWRHLDG